MKGRELNTLSENVLGLAIEVHKHLGPGLLESAYEECLCWELTHSGISFRRQVPLPVSYKDISLDAAYRLDVVIEGCLLLEIKSVDAIAPIHQAQLLTYLRLSKMKLGLLLNFNTVVLKDGIKRMIL